MLRLQVEEALADDAKGVALFSRPASLQGLLDLVREITQDTIVQQQTLQGPIARAWDLLWQGDGAVAAGDFPRAYELCGKVYGRRPDSDAARLEPTSRHPGSSGSTGYG